mgnify:CR=1 FL=1
MDFISDLKFLSLCILAKFEMAMLNFSFKQ